MIRTLPHKPVTGADCFTYRDISGTGADAFVRGPSIAMRRWHGLGWMRCRARDCWQDVYHGTEGSAFEVPCVRYQDGRLTPEIHRYYPVPVGLEWEIVWPDRRSVPACGYVDFDLQSSPGAVPHYQPRQSGLGIHQPENVPGSYACYAPWSGRYLRCDGSEIVNFETGKLWHLYRSFVRTARGDLAWCRQRIVENRLRVWLPMAFIRSLGPRDYPLTLGPTIGITSPGASNTGVGANNIELARYGSPASNGTLTEISVYCKNDQDSKSVHHGCYSGYGTSATLAAVTSGTTLSKTFAWHPVATTTNPTISTSTSYQLATTANSSSFNIKYDNTSVTNIERQQSYVAGSMPSPIGGTEANWNLRWTMFATYTESGGSSGFPFPLLFSNVHGSPFRR